jgi:hypothetical protein
VRTPPSQQGRDGRVEGDGDEEDRADERILCEINLTHSRHRAWGGKDEGQGENERKER